MKSAPQFILLAFGTILDGVKATPILAEELQSRADPKACATTAETPVWNIANEQASYATVCRINQNPIGCTITSSNDFANLANAVAVWVNANALDASAAGRQVKRRDTEVTTWGDLHSRSIVNMNALNSINALATRAEIHKDGFSASFDLATRDSSDASAGVLEERATCAQQIHIHYWALQGESGTLLSDGKIKDLALHAMNDAKNNGFGNSCYHLRNNGAWNGYLRVCFNKNRSQVGCGSCGGHNN
ncbi:hypothetical protein B0H63DRAFT_443141 [Podospora didyma]|uniref:SCP domain-containing protein n=1 Tax=Podospora didyma TaxID=330526 RepID=A0AAE0U6K6_9PEZI|nr:hypothetical protein B0H63DRAFT_443141 [Podospora didyma]